MTGSEKYLKEKVANTFYRNEEAKTLKNKANQLKQKGCGKKLQKGRQRNTLNIKGSTKNILNKRQRKTLKEKVAKQLKQKGSGK